MTETATPIVGTTEDVPKPQVVPALTPPSATPINFTLTGNKGVDTLIAFVLAGASLRGAEWGVEHIAALHGFDALSLSTVLFGVLAGLAGGLWAWVNTHLSQNKLAEAVMSGVNLATAGKSISVENLDGTVSPKPVTPESAAAIIKDFSQVQVKVPDAAK